MYIITLLAIIMFLAIRIFRLARKYKYWNACPIIKKCYFFISVIFLPATLLFGAIIIEHYMVEIPSIINNYVQKLPKCDNDIAAIQKKEFGTYEYFYNNSGTISATYAELVHSRYGFNTYCWTDWDVRRSIEFSWSNKFPVALFFATIIYLTYLLPTIIFFPFAVLRNNELDDVTRLQMELLGRTAELKFVVKASQPEVTARRSGKSKEAVGH